MVDGKINVVSKRLDMDKHDQHDKPIIKSVVNKPVANIKSQSIIKKTKEAPTIIKEKPKPIIEKRTKKVKKEIQKEIFNEVIPEFVPIGTTSINSMYESKEYVSYINGQNH